MTLIILVAVFLGATALTGALVLLITARRGSPAEERLEVLARERGSLAAADQNGTAGLLAVSLDADERPGLCDQFVARCSLFRRLVEQAGLNYSPARVFLACLVLASVGGFVTTFARLQWGLGPLAALITGSLPLIWVLWKRHQRLAKFERQLPEAMELLARSLRAGHSVVDGIRLIAEEMAMPISGEFRRCYDRQNLGKPLDDALQELAERIPNLDVRFFATSVILQRQTGGDMAEILEKIGRLIRQRLQIRGQIKALTGEGRLSAAFLLTMPLVLALYMYVRDPEYLRPLVEHPLGQKMTLYAIGLQILGAITIKKIVDIKV
jgi:tight adherence protein B